MTQATATKTRLNWSTLRYMATSAKLLKFRQEHPEPETPALILGRAIHCAILEPAEFDKRWVVAQQCAGVVKSTGAQCGSQGSLFMGGQWYCKVKGHAPNGAGPLPDGVEVITLEGLELVKHCLEAVQQHRTASKILTGGVAEEELEWQDPVSGILCRGRLDYLKPAEVVDLKSTVGETEREIERTIIQRLYYAQLAWYHDGAIAAGRLQPDAPLPLLVAVQTVEPYDVVPFRLSKIAFEAGRIIYRDLIRKYADCLAADHWPGLSANVKVLDIPDWAPGMNGSNYGGDW